MNTVLIKQGVYRNTEIENQVFELVRPVTRGKKGTYITVRNDGSFDGPDNIRVSIDNHNSVEFAGGAVKNGVVEFKKTKTESDEEVMERIGKRFDILHDMTRAAINGDVRAMIVTGPPGVGKSFGVEYELEKSSIFDRIGGNNTKYEVIKGAMTPVGLYATLYKHSDKNHVLVFDDCDSILLDDLSLNILKAALDSGKKRRIYWNADSSKLRGEGIPNSFDFHGSVIFITNLKFEHIKSKKLKDHLDALQSRCHYLDLTMDTMRDCFLRIKQIFRKGELFRDYKFTPEVGEEILDFMDKNQNRLREMSLRMALKIADLTRVSSDNWRELAESTCMRRV